MAAIAFVRFQFPGFIRYQDSEADKEVVVARHYDRLMVARSSSYSSPSVRMVELATTTSNSMQEKMLDQHYRKAGTRKSREYKPENATCVKISDEANPDKTPVRIGRWPWTIVQQQIDKPARCGKNATRCIALGSVRARI